jgi:glycosyltransferase involved in cell wall biosynthesis
VRLAIVNLFFPPDGSPTARLAHELARHRARRGDEVTVVTSRARYAPARRGEEPGEPKLTVHRVFAPRGAAVTVRGRLLQYAAFFASAAWRMLRLPRQDVIICMSTPPFAGLLGALHRLLHPRTRLVLWCMDCYPEILEACGLIRAGGGAARALRRVSRFLLARSDQVVCPDQAMADLLKAFHAPPRLRAAWSVVPNWEPRAAFPGRSGPWEGTKRLGLERSFVVLHLGNAGYGHDFRSLVQAAQELRGDRVRFLFLGGGVEHARLRETALRLGLDNLLVEPYVAQDQLAAAAASADMGLVALADAALGVMCPSKLHTYLASGLPVLYIGPPGGNVSEAIERFACGVRVAQGDARGLAAALRRAMADSRWLKHAGRRARAAFEEAYCDEAALPPLDRVIDSAGSRAAKPGDAVARAAA